MVLADEIVITDPIELLEGRRTDDGWIIQKRITKSRVQTGGAFSVCYTAIHEKDGREAFFKALDFRMALESDDPARDLQDLTAAYNFERDVLKLCNNHGLNRVVRAIGSGFLKEDGAPLNRIFYLIFELAEGDVRKQSNAQNRYDVAWSMAALHHIAVGLNQLHQMGICHQDVKPSNVLVFNQGTVSKLADLGRAHCISLQAPHDALRMPGASSYAPPEQLYHYHDANWKLARQGADLYLLGSLLHFLIVGVGMSVATASHLHEDHQPWRFADDRVGWKGTFHDVLPFYRAAHAEAVQAFAKELRRQIGDQLYAEIGKSIVSLLKWLTEPDPHLRGHPRGRAMTHGNPYSLDRFISEIAIQAKSLALRIR